MSKIKHMCKNCSKEFEDYFSDTKFCSRNCYEEHRQVNRKTKQIVCPICGNEFIQRHIGQIFCSRKCRIENTKDRVRCVCEYCGEPFERKRSEVDKNKRHYCSNECRMSAMFWSEEDTNILINSYKIMSYKEMSENNIFSVYSCSGGCIMPEGRSSGRSHSSEYR
jgi:hypothetical protein